MKKIDFLELIYVKKGGMKFKKKKRNLLQKEN